jgi:hypothetical protein
MLLSEGNRRRITRPSFMIDWIIPLIVGALIAGGVIVVPLLMRSNFRGVNRQTNNPKSGALSPDPKIARPDQNIVSDPKNWLRNVEKGVLRILGQIALGIIIGVIILFVIMPLIMNSLTPTVR